MVKKAQPDPELKDMVLEDVDTSQQDVDLRKKAKKLVEDMHKKAGCHAVVMVARHTELFTPPFCYTVSNTCMKDNTTDLTLNANLTFLICSCGKKFH